MTNSTKSVSRCGASAFAMKTFDLPGRAIRLSIIIGADRRDSA